MKRKEFLKVLAGTAAIPAATLGLADCETISTGQPMTDKSKAITSAADYGYSTRRRAGCYGMSVNTDREATTLQSKSAKGTWSTSAASTSSDLS